METKRYCQTGTFSIIMLSLLLIVSVLLAFTYGSEDPIVLAIAGIMAGISVILLLVFYKLVIEIDETTISFKLGIGLFKHSYRIDSIIQCRSVNNFFITGFGVHKISKGWLYNVSGFKAIELTFRSSGKVIRIGTDRPDEIAAVMTELLKINPGEGNGSIPDNQSKKSLIGLLITLLAVSLFLYYEYQPAKIDLLTDRMVIKGSYGIPVSYPLISSIDTISRMPRIEMRTNGIGIGRVCKGHFRLAGTGDALLFLNTGIQPFIVIKLKSDRIIYLNTGDRESTLDLYQKMKAKIK